MLRPYVAKSCESLLSVSQCDPFKWHEVQLSICLNYWSATRDGVENILSVPQSSEHIKLQHLCERPTSGPFTILCVGYFKI